MMLDMLDLAGKSVVRKSAIELLGKAAPFRAVTQALTHEL